MTTIEKELEQMRQQLAQQMRETIQRAQLAALREVYDTIGDALLELGVDPLPAPPSSTPTADAGGGRGGRGTRKPNGAAATKRAATAKRGRGRTGAPSPGRCDRADEGGCTDDVRSTACSTCDLVARRCTAHGGKPSAGGTIAAHRRGGCGA